MGLFGFLILGVAASALARLIIPGKQPMGWLLTLLLGIIDAILGGILFHASLTSFFSLTTWLLAVGGAVIVLLVYGLIFGRHHAT